MEKNVELTTISNIHSVQDQAEEKTSSFEGLQFSSGQSEDWAVGESIPKRNVGVWQLASLVYLLTAGGGYGLEPLVGAAGPLPAIIGILIFPWIWSVPQALMTAELSTMFPKDGGFVLWVYEAFGSFCSFQVGWWTFVDSLVDNALLPRLFSDYLSVIIGNNSISRWWTTLGGIVILSFCTALNVIGLHMVGWASVLFTIFVCFPFLLLALMGIPRASPQVWLSFRGWKQSHWRLYFASLLWNLCGYDSAGTCAGEVRNASKTYPKAILLSCAMGIVSFLLPILSTVTYNQNWELWTDAFWPRACNQVVDGRWLGYWIALGGIISSVGMLNSLLATSSRALYGMVICGLLPKHLGYLHSMYATPIFCILLVSLGTAFCSIFSFESLLQVDSVLYSLKLALELCSFIGLRYSQGHLLRPFRVAGGKKVVWLLVVSGLFCCCGMIMLSNWVAAMTCVVMIVLGIVLYLTFQKLGCIMMHSVVPTTTTV
ncbi:hypothetical protein GpartN1_g6439.t1 [Galdieria partita]|uniref:Uncharacterized protein n=1 Tax=Galdieria partita TaxID=83374 RepID=A0A9C7UT93_9RHOD|nr:hypothetical protein GpartN1_g6439.t1 [Galdieria partita]